MPVIIKNCGLKTPEAIATSIDSGASFLGFVIHTASPRHVEPAQLPHLLATIPSHIHNTYVMVNPSDDDISAILSLAKPHYLQLHGDEDVARLQHIKATFDVPIIKAFGISNAQDVRDAQRFDGCADYLLLDAKSPTEYGGTGQSFDWALLAGFSPKVPWFLSGGLNATNVVEAIQQTHAKMVDVSSGIESSRGVKDRQKIIAFNEAVRHIES